MEKAMHWDGCSPERKISGQRIVSATTTCQVLWWDRKNRRSTGFYFFCNKLGLVWVTRTVVVLEDERWQLRPRDVSCSRWLWKEGIWSSGCPLSLAPRQSISFFFFFFFTVLPCIHFQLGIKAPSAKVIKTWYMRGPTTLVCMIWSQTGLDANTADDRQLPVMTVNRSPSWEKKIPRF